MRKLVLLAALLLLAACAETPTGDASSTPPPTGGASSTPPPTMSPPASPPTSASDPRPAKNVLVGRITRGGEGPCYGLETDEGKQYALYNADGMSLPVGTTVRVETAPLMLKINCGPGEHLSAVKIDRVG
ncbi:hypothetical protein ACTMTJ_00055 [Phytohabitans sp. LJ34]|uniref:hypothetical protein n=1 Tax=Phytohabitans sp. LJ34 TaxID=3452217 RepID=UPI003F898E9A